MSSNFNRSALSISENKIKILKSLDIRLKTVEVCLASLCLGLGLDAFMNGAVPQWPGVGLCCILTGAYVILTGVAIGCRVFADPLPKPLSVALSAVGGLLFAATAANVLRSWELAAGASGPGVATLRYATGLRQMHAQGMMAMVAAAAFMVDAAYEGVVGPWLRNMSSPVGIYALPSLHAGPVTASGAASAHGYQQMHRGASPYRGLNATPSVANAGSPRSTGLTTSASLFASLGRGDMPAVPSPSQRLPPVSVAAAAARRFHRIREARENSERSRISTPRPTVIGYDKRRFQ